MFNHIYGKVIYCAKTYIIIETYGVGYKLNFKESETLQVGENKRFFIHTINKTDNKNYITSEMYAFTSPIERNLFAELLTVNGIGPVIASNIISAGYKNIIKYIIDEDVEALKTIRGLNERTSRQIIASLIPQCKKIAETLEITNVASKDGEFISAMKQLGYNPQEISLAVKSTENEKDLDERIGKSIRIIAESYESSKS